MKTSYKILNTLLVTISAFVFLSCSENGKTSDAYGNFEAQEYIVAAEMNGKIVRLQIEEGQKLSAQSSVGLIDTTALYLQKAPLLAQRKTAATATQDIRAQIQVLEEKKKTLLTEKQRIEKLLEDEAATQQQLDKITGEINVIEQQIEQVKVQNSRVLSELEVFDAKIAQINDQIARCKIINPVEGIVLEQYTENNEMAAAGKAIYKVADLSTMYLRVYVSGDQLPSIKIGQKVTVLFDKTKDTNQSIEGEISWIASEAEFTPKIIQTKEERVNLVYAVKVRVNNNGSIKIGMPGEIKI